MYKFSHVRKSSSEIKRLPPALGKENEFNLSATSYVSNILTKLSLLGGTLEIWFNGSAPLIISIIALRDS
jgi:hypothetical protein